MPRKLLMTAAVVAITIASIGTEIAEADGGGFHGGAFHAGVVVHGGGIHHGVFHHRGFFGGRSFPGNGYGYDGFAAYPDTDTAADVPPISVVPRPVPAVLAGDRPPCHETTTEGVVVDRGSSCSHGSQ
jgi:hypothetical protein